MSIFQILIKPDKLFEIQAVFNLEFSGCGALQRRKMCSAFQCHTKVAGKSPDVCSLAAFDANPDFRKFDIEQLNVKNFYFGWL